MVKHIRIGDIHIYQENVISSILADLQNKTLMCLTQSITLLNRLSPRTRNTI